MTVWSLSGLLLSCYIGAVLRDSLLLVVRERGRPLMACVMLRVRVLSQRGLLCTLHFYVMGFSTKYAGFCSCRCWAQILSLNFPLLSSIVNTVRSISSLLSHQHRILIFEAALRGRRFACCWRLCGCHARR